MQITQTIAQCNSQLLELKHRNAGEQERCNREMENTVSTAYCVLCVCVFVLFCFTSKHSPTNNQGKRKT